MLSGPEIEIQLVHLLLDSRNCRKAGARVIGASAGDEYLAGFDRRRSRSLLLMEKTVKWTINRGEVSRLFSLMM